MRRLELGELAVEVERDPVRARSQLRDRTAIVRYDAGSFPELAAVLPFATRSVAIRTGCSAGRSRAPPRTIARIRARRRRREVDRLALLVGVAQRTQRGARAGCPRRPGPHRPAVADEEAGDEEERADEVEAERDRALGAGAEQQPEAERDDARAARPRWSEHDARGGAGRDASDEAPDAGRRVGVGAEAAPERAASPRRVIGQRSSG